MIDSDELILGSLVEIESEELIFGSVEDTTERKYRFGLVKQQEIRQTCHINIKEFKLSDIPTGSFIRSRKFYGENEETFSIKVFPNGITQEFRNCFSVSLEYHGPHPELQVEIDFKFSTDLRKIEEKFGGKCKFQQTADKISDEYCFKDAFSRPMNFYNLFIGKFKRRNYTSEDIFSGEFRIRDKSEDICLGVVEENNENEHDLSSEDDYNESEQDLSSEDEYNEIVDNDENEHDLSIENEYNETVDKDVNKYVYRYEKLLIECQIIINYPTVTEKMFHNPKYWDFTLEVGGQNLRVHKAILSAESSVFAAMFNSDMVEKQQNKCTINDMDFEIIKRMIVYIYTGKCDNLHENAAEVFVVADKYDLQDLKNLCEEKLCSHTRISTIASMLLFADIYNAKKLEKAALDFLERNVNYISDTPNWKSAKLPDYILKHVIRIVVKKNSDLESQTHTLQYWYNYGCRCKRRKY